MTTPIFIAGAGRGGTTFLLSTLGSHSQVCKCRHKEPCYFDRNWHLGEDFYKNLFNIKSHELYTVEASTNYIWYPDALEKIKQFNPNSKIILSLRNPGERAFAEYKRRIEKNGEDRSFDYIFNNTGYGKKRSAYLSNIVRLKKLFPAENIKILVFEKWKSNPEILRHEMEDFLNIDMNGFKIPTQKKNASSVPISKTLQKIRKKYFYSDQSESYIVFRVRAIFRKAIDWVNHLAPGLRKFPSVKPYKPMLKKYYSEEIIQLENLLNEDLSVWKEWYD